jgi:hypothetical protein
MQSSKTNDRATLSSARTLRPPIVRRCPASLRGDGAVIVVEEHRFRDGEHPAVRAGELHLGPSRLLGARRAGQRGQPARGPWSVLEPLPMQTLRVFTSTVSAASFPLSTCLAGGQRSPARAKASVASRWETDAPSFAPSPLAASSNSAKLRSSARPSRLYTRSVCWQSNVSARRQSGATSAFFRLSPSSTDGWSPSRQDRPTSSCRRLSSSSP